MSASICNENYKRDDEHLLSDRTSYSIVETCINNVRKMKVAEKYFENYTDISHFPHISLSVMNDLVFQ